MIPTKILDPARRKPLVTSLFCTAVSAAFAFLVSTGITAQVGAASSSAAIDPGVRAGTASAGAPLSTLSADELAYFQDGQARFVQTDAVGDNLGLGPTFNSTVAAVATHSRQPEGQVAAATRRLQQRLTQQDLMNFLRSL